MTILSAVRSFAAVVGLEIPDRLFGVSDRDAVETQALAAEMAARIAEHHDWRALARQFTIPAGAATFTLPVDFARFRQGTAITTPAGRVLNRIDPATPDYFPLGGWRVVGGIVLLSNPPGDVLTGTYQSNGYVVAENGSTRAEFLHDSDRFALNERLLTLGMIWQWKANKGLPYGQDYDNYERAIGKAVGTDGPRTVLEIGGRSRFEGAKLAWPGILGTPDNLP